MLLINKHTLLKELCLNSNCEKYLANLFYGWDYKNDERKISSFNPDVWPIKKVLNGLNKLAKLDKLGLVKLISYSKNKKLNFILISQKQKSKIAIVASGGGYCCNCNAIESLPVGLYLYKKGYSIVIPTYSINKDARDGKATLDFIDLISYLENHKKQLNIDLKDYVIGGFSAGGHAVGMLLTKDFSFDKYYISRPRLMFLGYPIITMGEGTHIHSKNIVVGEKPTKEKINKFSIELGLNKPMCKLFFWQCKHDKEVSFENFKKLEKASKEANYTYMCRSYDSDAHGWGIASGKLADGWLDEMLDFIK